MLTWPTSVRVFLCRRPTDLRRSFDRLAAMVQEVLHEDPFSGHLFVFVNRPRDRVKILLWDRSGFWLLYKRLEQGCFRLPEGSEDVLAIDSVRLSLILEGIDLAGARQQKRYHRPTGERFSAEK
ncbi:IS66 family insertion sequence element accessory protein TnpB [Candidatus Bathyarchaeota archaeon]|jgi:transposase|nr:IS66 family insertion sequence element accessory protein TnpB [Candidatus Bathyarchaeota archaeon]